MHDVKKQNKLINIAITVIAVIGIFYVALQIFTTKRIQETENPFEYNIDHYKNTSIQPAFILAETLQLALEKPTAITITHQNELVVAGSIAVHIYDTNLDRAQTFDLQEPATCVAAWRDTFYVGMQSGFSSFTKNGNPLTYHIDDEENTYFTSIAVNDDFIFLADAGNRVVKKYSKSGNFLARLAEANEEKGIPKLVIPSPYFDIALEEANLWIVNPGIYSSLLAFVELLNGSRGSAKIRKIAR